MNDELQGLSSNLIEFPKGRICLLEGEYYRIFGMLIGCCLDDNGRIRAFRIPLENDSRIPLQPIMDASEDSFVLLPEDCIIDSCMFEKLLNQRREFDMDDVFIEEIYNLQSNGIEFRKEEEGPFKFSVYKKKEKGCYSLVGFPLDYEFVQENLGIFCGVLFDMAIFQQYTGTRVVLGCLYELEISSVLKKFNDILDNIYNNGLWMTDTDEAPLFFDGLTAYNQYMEGESMTLEEFKSRYTNVFVRIEPSKN